MADEEPGQADSKPQSEPPMEANPYDVVDRPAPKPPPSKIDEPSVLEGFDEDTDFDKDPALKEAQARARNPARAALANPYTVTAGDSADESVDVPIVDPLIRDGLLPIKVVASIGGVLALVAAGIKWNDAELGSGLPLAILSIYFCLLHAVTGTVALIIMSLLQKRPAGKYGLGAARMLVAVSAFMALASIQMPFGLSFIIAAPAYLFTVMILFKVRPNVAIQIAGLHGAIALAVQLGFILQELGMPTKGGK